MGQLGPLVPVASTQQARRRAQAMQGGGREGLAVSSAKERCSYRRRLSTATRAAAPIAASAAGFFSRGRRLRV